MIPEDTVNKELTLMADTLDKTAITKQATTNLTECLTAYTKDQMLEIAEKAGYSVKKSYTKSRIADDMIAQMKTSLRTELAYLAKEEHAALLQLMEQPAEGRALDVFLPYTFSWDMIQRGWVYVFKKGDRYSLVLPGELAQWMQPLLEDKPLMDEMERNQEVFEHLTALTNLYGVFGETVAWSVWQKRESVHSVDKETFFAVASRMQGKLEKYQKENELFYAPQHLNAEEAQALNNRRTVSGYFLPGETDLLFYSLNEVDSRNPAYEKLKGYLQQKYPQKEEMVTHVLHEIGMNAVMNKRVQDLIQFLDETLQFTFESAEEYQEFSKLYADLSNSTRKWVLKGHTPDELRAAERNTRSRRQTSGRTAQKQMPIRVNKVGRNEPCPCGSGKKYKKCHGR